MDINPNLKRFLYFINFWVWIYSYYKLDIFLLFLIHYKKISSYYPIRSKEFLSILALKYCILKMIGSWKILNSLVKYLFIFKK